MNALHRRCLRCGHCVQCDKAHPWVGCKPVTDRKTGLLRPRRPSKGWVVA